jgi:putative acetyltransferase
MDVSLQREEITAQSARALISALNAELSEMYPEPGANHFDLHASEVAPGHGAFLVAYREQRPVGCGAVRLIDPSSAELKRMYVAPECRGAGVGRRLLEALEAEARRLGAERLVLETGGRQTAALALYERCGFKPIALYGEYCSTPTTSICLGKSILK